MNRKNKWDAWDFDEGETYIIAKSECSNKDDARKIICQEDGKTKMDVYEGWCRWEVKINWENGDDSPQGGYTIYKQPVKQSFPVWIVRKVKKQDSEWIPVEKRLPEDEGDYWVTMRHLDGSVTTEALTKRKKN